MHIACLRRDTPEFMERLISLGAKLEIKDLFDKTPFDYFSATYEEVQALISQMTDGHEFENDEDREYLTFVARLRIRHERENNIACLLAMYCSPSAESAESSSVIVRHASLF